MPDTERDFRNARDAIQAFIDADYRDFKHDWPSRTPASDKDFGMTAGVWRACARRIAADFAARTPAPDQVVTTNGGIDGCYRKQLEKFLDYLVGCVK